MRRRRRRKRLRVRVVYRSNAWALTILGFRSIGAGRMNQVRIDQRCAVVVFGATEIDLLKIRIVELGVVQVRVAEIRPF